MRDAVIRQHVKRIDGRVSRTSKTQVTDIRQTIITLPLLSVGTTTVDITWPTPFGSANYTVQATLIGPAQGIGGLTVALVEGSQTTTTCQITLTNTTLASIQLGRKLAVLGIRTGGS